MNAPSWDEPDRPGVEWWVAATALTIVCASVAAVTAVLLTLRLAIGVLLTANDPQSSDLSTVSLLQAALPLLLQVLTVGSGWLAAELMGRRRRGGLVLAAVIGAVVGCEGVGLLHSGELAGPFLLMVLAVTGCGALTSLASVLALCFPPAETAVSPVLVRAAQRRPTNHFRMSSMRAVT